MEICADIGDQLALFVDPQAVVDLVYSGDWSSVDLVDYGDDPYDLWDTKLADAIESNMVDDMRSWTYFKPVVVKLRPYGNLLGNGHHRIAASAALGLPLIPVVWTATLTFARVDTRDDHNTPSWLVDDSDDDEDTGPYDGARHEVPDVWQVL